MPNRIIKESIRTSYEIDDLSPEAEITFYRLLTFADDFGRFPSDKRVLQSALFPLRPSIRSNDFTRWIAELTKAGLIRLFLSKKKPFGFFPTWEKHQNRRSQTSKYPKPEGEAFQTLDDQLRAIDAARKHVIADDITCNHTQADSPVLDTRTRTRYSILESDARAENPEPPNRFSNPESRGLQPFDDELETLYQKYLNWMSSEKGRLVDVQQEELQRAFLKQQPDPKAVLEQSMRNGWMKLVPIEQKNHADNNQRTRKGGSKETRADTFNRRGGAVLAGLPEDGTEDD